MTLLQYIIVCWRMWSELKKQSYGYLTITPPSGIPTLAVFMARDREAWQVTQFAIENGFNAVEGEPLIVKREPEHN